MTLKIKEGSSSKEAKKNLSSIFDNESTCWDNAYTKKEWTPKTKPSIKIDSIASSTSTKDYNEKFKKGRIDLNGIINIQFALNERSSDLLIKTLILISSIKEGIIKHLLYEIEIAVEKLTYQKQKNRSILKKLDENEMLSFSWMSVFNELDANLTLAVRMFCILCGFNKKTVKKMKKRVLK